MKTKITTLILSLITSISFAQLTFVKEITQKYIYPPLSSSLIDTEVNLIENGEYIITRDYDYDSSLTYNILDKNFNLYKSIKIDITINSTGGILRSENPVFSSYLFNNNDKIEYYYTVRECDREDEWNGGICKYRTIIADEDNNVLMSIEGLRIKNIWDFFIIGGKTYLRSEFYENNVATIKIYEVAGNLPCLQCNSKASNTNTTKSPAPNYAFKIFPNPTDGQLNIESDLDELNMQIKIYSTSGQLLQTDPFFYGTNSVNVSSLASGTYVINIVSEKGFLHTEKFVKR